MTEATAGPQAGERLLPPSGSGIRSRTYICAMNCETSSSLRDFILDATGASELFEVGTLQSLWSGYGRIVRFGLQGADLPSVVVKQVRPARSAGKGDDWGHRRKVRSYEVEAAWYAQGSARCDAGCRVPRCLAQQKMGDEVWLVLEDLDASGYSLRRSTASAAEVRACLSWLAHFHANFMGEKPVGLWKVGTYWHLDTRPEELRVMDDEALRKAAPTIDRRLRQSPFQTWVHGDAKLANFCFSRSQGVAAVDFQYVGGGCGMKDVAYLLDSCYEESAVERLQEELLGFYFKELRAALVRYGKPVDGGAVEADWRGLYALAWTDFYRFLKGWSPGSGSRQGYSERLSRQVLAAL